MAYVCREMGWDYWTYMSQPVFFVRTVESIMKKEAADIRKLKSRK
jgi:hypothetical protein